MTRARKGDKVRVHYTGKLEDGSVFDTSEQDAPLEFTLGRGEVIPGFDQAVLGMTPGQSKTATIPATEAYGPHHEEMVAELSREHLPDDLDAEIGDQLQLRMTDGHDLVVLVRDTSEDSITVDANHPLAGKDLTFSIELVEICPD